VVILKEFQFKKNNFDLIRLLAALQVVIVHGYEHLGLERGKWFIDFISVFPGVPIFFVISGFLISASWERSSSFYSYVQNRVLRIYPALWGCLLFSVLTVILVYPINVSLIGFTKWIVAQISIGQFYNPDFLRDYGVGVLNGSLWTIPVELQFYLLLPVLYFCFSKVQWSRALLLTVLISLIAINQVYVYIQGSESYLAIKFFGVTVLPYLYIFMVGVILQRNIFFVRQFLADKAVYWLIIYLASVILLAYLDFNYKGNYLNPLLAILLSLLTVSFAYSYSFKLGNILRGNDISYGVYIYHMVFVNLLIHINEFAPMVNFILVVMCTVSAALISWRLIEKPALALKKYSVRRSKDKMECQ
tara:strand:+ start:672 stop:1751 length:1080 start_codon:yes stop_codon:yes gene_type:complete